jgi:gliding motility-associated-like protein
MKKYQIMKTLFRTLSLLLSLLLASTVAYATHIVGGELEMRFISGTTYRFNLIMYFDAINGNPDAIDPTADINIFQKSNNVRIQSLVLPRVSDEAVSYTNPACAVGALRTRKITYSLVVTLNATTYNHPQGYYMSWERCCRNGVINNITNPGAAGQVFYAEFPPLLQGSTRFINSTPQIFPPLSDYACINQPFYFNFGGTDFDGDELRYSIVTPLNGNSTASDPRPSTAFPAPYSLVNYAAGFSLSNIIQGNPPLQINPNTGQLILTASRVGLFVFAVRCEEFRNGIKIGEVRRDFQLMVLDCPRSRPPVAVVRRLGSTVNLTDRDTIILRLGETNRCAEIVVSDPDNNTPIRARVIPRGATNPSQVTLSPNGGTIVGTGTLNLRACVPNCPTNLPATFLFDVIVEDNSCAVPLIDTAKINIKILPDLNLKPTVTTSLTNIVNKEYRAEVLLGRNLTFNVIGNDANTDQIAMSAFGQGFTLASVGMNFPTAQGLPVLTRAFSWTPACGLLRPDEREKEFVVKFPVIDTRNCGGGLADTTTVRITVKNPVQTNQKPTISTTLKYDAVRKLYYDTVYVLRNIRFDVIGDDADKDTIALSFAPIGTNVSAGATFSGTRGLPIQRGRFSWNPPCSAADPVKDVTGKPYDYLFTVADFGTCRASVTDTMRVRIFVKPVPNLKPSIKTDLPFDNLRKLYYDSVVVGGNFQFNVIGDDPEKDIVSMAMQGIGFNPSNVNMTFTSQTGKAQQVGVFRWRTNCSFLDDSLKAKDYNLRFIVNDTDSCNRQKFDTTFVRLRVLPNLSPNEKPKVTTSLPTFIATTKTYVDTVIVGRNYTFDVLGDDANKDSLLLRGNGIGFNFATMRMNFAQRSGRPILKSPFTWQTTCDMLNIKGGETSKEFVMQFLVNDFRDCQRSKFDTIRVRLILKLDLKPNNAPEASATNLTLASRKTYTKTVIAGETLNFKVLVTDADKDSVSITATGLADGMTFVSAKGIAPIEGNFTWQTNCSLLRGTNNAPKDYALTFLARDFRGCDNNKFDTIKVNLRLIPVPNPNPPRIFTDSTKTVYNRTTREYSKKLTIGEEISLDITAVDSDRDIVSITGNGVDFNMADFGIQFSPVTGTAPQTTKLTWKPDCDMLKRKTEYRMKFVTQDQNACGLVKTDEIFITFTINDLSVIKDFTPYNVFTPNNDGKNDTFMLDIPLDNCVDSFNKITIYDRWGRFVFESTSRTFVWDGGGLAPGTYYYLIQFKNKQVKGWVSLMRGE